MSYFIAINHEDYGNASEIYGITTTLNEAIQIVEAKMAAAPDSYPSPQDAQIEEWDGTEQGRIYRLFPISPGSTETTWRMIFTSNTQSETNQAASARTVTFRNETVR